MARVVIDGNQSSDPNVFRDVNELTIFPTRYGQYIIWFGIDDEIYIQTEDDIKISVVSQHKNTIKINT